MSDFAANTFVYHYMFRPLGEPFVVDLNLLSLCEMTTEMARVYRKRLNG